VTEQFGETLGDSKVAASRLVDKSMGGGSDGGMDAAPDNPFSARGGTRDSCRGDRLGISDNCQEVEGADGPDTSRLTEDADVTADDCRAT